jgi:hypothetical protein
MRSFVFLIFSVIALGNIQYSGSAFTTTITADGVKQDFINAIETALKNGGNGWTTISGSGTTNLLMQSGTTPQGLQINVRFRDQGGECIQIYMESTDGTLHSVYGLNPGLSLVPTNGLVYTVVASKYQFLIYTTNIGTSRQFAWVGMPYLNSALAANITRAGFAFGNAGSDSDVEYVPTIRNFPSVARCCGLANYELMLNNNWWENVNSNANSVYDIIGAPRLILNGVNEDWNMTISSPTAYRWNTATPSVLTGDVYLAWNPIGCCGEALINGQVWDCVYIADAQPINTTATFDTHNWINLTDSNNGQLRDHPRGGLWFATN